MRNSKLRVNPEPRKVVETTEDSDKHGEGTSVVGWVQNESDVTSLASGNCVIRPLLQDAGRHAHAEAVVGILHLHRYPRMAGVHEQPHHRVEPALSLLASHDKDLGGLKPFPSRAEVNPNGFW